MKKSVVFFLESLSGGGAEQVLVTLLRHFDFSEYDVTLVTMVDCGVHVKDIDQTKIKYKPVIKQSNSWFGQIWNKFKYKLFYNYLPASTVAKIVFGKGFDINISFIEGYCTKIISCLSRGTKVTWVHTDLKFNPYTLQNHIFSSLQEETSCYAKYDKVVCVSHSVEQVMQSYYGLKNTVTIYNPIDVAHIRSLATVKNDVIVSENFKLASIGRLVPQKGYDLLMPVINRLVSEDIDVSLYLIGEGPDRNLLQTQIDRAGLNDNIFLLGYHDNPYSILKDMDLFVCSSRAEGYSLVIAEALTLNIPVVSMNCSGPNELLDNSKYGILCDNYDELYEAIKKCILDKAYYESLKDKAWERASFFDIQNVMTQIYDMINL